MPSSLINIAISILTIILCFFVAEGALRIIDGQSPVAVVLPVMASSPGTDTTAAHLDAIPRAASVPRDLFLSTPPLLPNRKPVPKDWLDLYLQVQNLPRSDANAISGFLQPLDVFKAWNSAFVGDPCN